MQTKRASLWPLGSLGPCHDVPGSHVPSRASRVPQCAYEVGSQLVDMEPWGGMR